MNNSVNKPGKKNDIIDNKPRWDLLPIEIVGDVVDVYTAGANKYGANNWQNIENGTDRCYAALMRHLVLWRSGEKIDQETGCYHLAQVIWNAITLLWYDKNRVNNK